MVIMGVQVWNKYNDTLDWEKQDPRATMATQSLDLLYDKDPLARKSKIEFGELRKSMLTKEGMLTEKANKTNISELKRLLGEINTKSSEVDYEKEYAEVALKYSLDIQYKELFENHDGVTFKDHVTPLTLAELNNSTFDDLNTLFKMNNNDQFVKDFILKERKMSHDVETFNEITSLFDQAVVIKDKSLTLKEGYTDNLEDQFLIAKSNLNYKWSSTDYMVRIVGLIAPMNQELIKDYASYKSYQTDLANKELAYSNWELTKNEWYATVEAIREQALAEKAAREEAARVKVLRDEELVIAIEEIDLLTNISDEERTNYLNRLSNTVTPDDVHAIVNEAKARDTFIVDEAERIEKEKEEEEKQKEEEANRPPAGTSDSSEPVDTPNEEDTHETAPSQ